MRSIETLGTKGSGHIELDVVQNRGSRRNDMNRLRALLRNQHGGMYDDDSDDEPRPATTDEKGQKVPGPLSIDLNPFYFCLPPGQRLVENPCDEQFWNHYNGYNNN